MKIFKPVTLNELGERKNNEDTIYPNFPEKDSTVFLVCDGVGGQAKGEIASQLICKHFPVFIYKNKNNFIDKEKLEEGLRYVEKKLIDYVEENPNAVNMASTLTVMCLLKNQNKVVFGWVGDSRIYHIRDGRVQYKTKDHSEVQNLLDMGEITEEEAKIHPRKNVITRAVNGKVPARIDYHVITDILANDFFLLCSDGVLENLDEKKIKQWFKINEDLEAIKAHILENANGRTKDNYSMQLIKIKELETTKKPKKKWFWQKF